MLELMGEVLRTHQTRELPPFLGWTVPGAEELVAEFVGRNREALRVHDAYIASRCLTSAYMLEEAETLLKTAEGVIKLAREAAKRCRR